MRTAFPISCLLAVIAILAMPMSTSAAEIQRNMSSQPAANCQAALPVFDGQIRKRPRALVNEGTRDAFITCAFESMPLTEVGKVDRVLLSFSNRGGIPGGVACTLVETVPDGASIVKGRDAAPGATESIFWLANDNGGAAYIRPALSCLLPPGFEIIGTEVLVREEIGS